MRNLADFYEQKSIVRRNCQFWGNFRQKFDLNTSQRPISPFLGSKGDFRDFGRWPNRAYLGTFGPGLGQRLQVKGWPGGRKIDFAPVLQKRTKRPDLARESTSAPKNANARESAANGHLRFPAKNPGPGPTKIGRSKWGVPVDPENGVCGSV